MVILCTPQPSTIFDFSMQILLTLVCIALNKRSYRPNPSSAQRRTYAIEIARFFLFYSQLGVHALSTPVPPHVGALATFTKLPSGCWRVQDGRKGQNASRCFGLSRKPGQTRRGSERDQPRKGCRRRPGRHQDRIRLHHRLAYPEPRQGRKAACSKAFSGLQHTRAPEWSDFLAGDNGSVSRLKAVSPLHSTRL